MNPIICTTSCVNTDEACLQLVEMNLVRPDVVGIHRYMIITVVRGDRPEDFHMDLGPATQFQRPELRLITGGVDPVTGKLWSEHNVGEAIELANHLREGPFEQPELPPTHDLARAYYDQLDIKRKARKKVSTFGPAAVLQRS